MQLYKPGIAWPNADNNPWPIMEEASDEGEYYYKEDVHDQLTQLRGNLSLAEEGLANYAQEVASARAAASDIAREAERLRTALRYWLPDETMIPAGHEIAWNEHVELIPEHRSAVPQSGPTNEKA